ncbi:hypothetical protein HEQ72_10925 [Haematospirillum sp. 15-248]|uniref:hypothetical protein n=1 Tax=Haematospirillum sp. 15-248 TaxID=2723107 RepID=UPI00143B3BAE|nr:hypothetical protein [Haematospirillum sp. 15-248]NKD88810.1 hypothetical protein [Haematospirillum sp. 15-248]
MIDDEWEIVDHFKGPGEYNRFLKWIHMQIANGNMLEVEIQEYYAGPSFDEKWYACKDSGRIWRLVAPQAPFEGFWGPVGESR